MDWRAAIRSFWVGQAVGGDVSVGGGEGGQEGRGGDVGGWREGKRGERDVQGGRHSSGCSRLKLMISARECTFVILNWRMNSAKHSLNSESVGRLSVWLAGTIADELNA